MKKKQFLVISIVIIIAFLACLTTYFIVNSHEESLSTFRISNSCTIEAPITNNTVESLENGVTKFIFEDSNVNITHQKTGNNTEIKKIYSDMIKNSEEVEDGIYYDSSTGTYFTFIEDKESGDAILIEAKDLNLLKRMAKSVKFTIPKTPDTNETNVTNDAPSEEGSDYPTEENSYPDNEPSRPSSDEKPSESTPNENEQVIR
jgi:hypothetical protein